MFIVSTFGLVVAIFACKRARLRILVAALALVAAVAVVLAVAADLVSGLDSDFAVAVVAVVATSPLT